MHSKFVISIFVAILIMAVSGCRKEPDYVIPANDMASIMADIHIAESVVEANYSDYQSDSAKMLLKQSVVIDHGYTMEQLDTSFMWYGANLVRYNDVYEKTIEILEKKLEENGVDIDRLHKNDIEQDSINIWPLSPTIFFKQTGPSRFLVFEPKTDDFEKGDIITLRARFNGMNGAASWTLTADYDDDSFEIINSKFNQNGWQEISLYLDSTKTVSKLNGNINFMNIKGKMIVDSIEMVRKPLNSLKYHMRYRQKSYKLENKVVEPVETDINPDM